MVPPSNWRNLALLDEQDPKEADILGSWGWEFMESCVFPMIWLPQGTGWSLPTEALLERLLGNLARMDP